MQEMDIRIGSLEGAYLQVADRLNGIDRGIAALRSDLSGEIAGLRSDTGSEISGLRNELRGEIAELRRDMNQRFFWMIGTTLTCFVALIAAFVSGWSSLIGAIAHR